MTLRSATPILFIAAVAGAATMTVELAAVRLLAPWFGASSRVWTNVIGVILLALAVGYLLGARLAERREPLRALTWVLLGCAAWTVWLPVGAGVVCRWFVPAQLTLDQAMELWTWGSLAATLVLFLPAAVALGCVGPLSVEAVQRLDGSHAGTAGGRVLGFSTLGSLVGTFGTTHVLVPSIGVSWTFVAAGATLFVLGAVLAVGVHRSSFGAAGVVSALFVVGALFGSRLDRGAVAEGLHVLAERESPYQSVRVVDDRRWGTPVRLLQVNEGQDSFQSVWVEQPGLLGRGYYYDLFALPAWWSAPRERWNVLVLGLGAGTTFRVLRGASPAGLELELSGVEIDPVVVAMGEEWFELDTRANRVFVGVDGRAALAVCDRDLDLIVLDAYARQVEIPFHLASVEALEEMRAHLAPGGWLAINVGGFDFDDPVVAALGATTAAVFGEATAYRVPASRNFVVFARNQAAVPLPSDEHFFFSGPVGDALLPSLALPGAHRVFTRTSAGHVLTDDRNPIDRLQMKSLEEARARLSALR